MAFEVRIWVISQFRVRKKRIRVGRRYNVVFGGCRYCPILTLVVVIFFCSFYDYLLRCTLPIFVVFFWMAYLT